jgi:hypothetical protein
MTSIQEEGAILSSYANELIAATDPGAAFSLMPDVIQGLFVVSILVMSIGPMWVKK